MEIDVEEFVLYFFIDLHSPCTVFCLFQDVERLCFLTDLTPFISPSVTSTLLIKSYFASVATDTCE